MILLIDNYDSFSYNLYQLIGSLDPDILPVRNDAMTVAQIRDAAPQAIILSPGPGRPENAGVCMDVIRQLGPSVPMLGVCLGHQAICAVYGATVSYARTLMHGKQSPTKLDPACPLFAGCPPCPPVARYHSLAAVPDTMPACLRQCAWADDGEIMAVMHQTHPVYGVQFHPESIMTPDGKTMLQNFLNLSRSFHAGDKK